MLLLLLNLRTDVAPSGSALDDQTLVLYNVIARYSSWVFDWVFADEYKAFFRDWVVGNNGVPNWEAKIWDSSHQSCNFNILEFISLKLDPLDEFSFLGLFPLDHDVNLQAS